MHGYRVEETTMFCDGKEYAHCKFIYKDDELLERTDLAEMYLRTVDLLMIALNMDPTNDNQRQIIYNLTGKELENGK